MKKSLLGILFGMSFIFSPLAQSADVNTKGEAYFINWGAADDVFAPFGGIVIGGDAAQAMWDAMEDARVRPAVDNLKSLKPADITRGNVEARVGVNYICLNMVTFTDDGQKLLLDSDGELVHYKQCDLNIANVKDGTLSSVE